MLVKHWSADLDFLEEELQFFKNIYQQYPGTRPAKNEAQGVGFEQKMKELETHLRSLRIKIPAFLSFLAPFIADLNKPMDLAFLEKYNSLGNELKQLFSDVRTTKKELFTGTEALMAALK